MKKSIALILAVALFVVLAGCGNSNQGKDTLPPAPTHDDTTPPAAPSARPPSVFVNDTYYQIFESRQSAVPELDESWDYLGTVQSEVSLSETPTGNFQASGSGIGAEIYHSYDGRIPLYYMDDYLGEKYGDSIIVVFNGQRSLYISNDVRDEIYRIFDTVQLHCLLVDGDMYKLRSIAGGGDFSLSDSYIFLGEVNSAVSLYELPTENLQANRELVIGAKVYRLPADETEDIVVFHDSNLRYYYARYFTGVG